MVSKLINWDGWEHENARWVALGCFIIGQLMFICLYFVNSFWAVEFLGGGALILWSVPMIWALHKYTKQGW